MQPGLAELLDATMAAYSRVHREAFLGDPVANPRLPVEVVSAEVAAGCPALVLLTPWTLNGLLFADDRAVVPQFLDVAGTRRPVFAITMPDLPPHASVNLVGDVSRWTSPEQARTVARSFAAPFLAGVEAALARPA
jgi:hypothetical protein